MVYGYIRVSTDKQTVENQRFEIIGYAKAQNIISIIIKSVLQHYITFSKPAALSIKVFCKSPQFTISAKSIIIFKTKN